MYNTPEFQALRREYLESCQERCNFLRGEAELLRSGAEVDLKRLRQEIHKFRGSGGFYGFKDLSAASGDAEDYLVQVFDGETDLHLPRLMALVERVVVTCEAAWNELPEIQP